MMVKTTIYLPEDVLRAVRIKVRDTGSSQADIIRSTVTDAVQDTKREMPQSFGSVYDGKIGSENLEQIGRSSITNPETTVITAIDLRPAVRPGAVGPTRVGAVYQPGT